MNIEQSAPPVRPKTVEAAAGLGFSAEAVQGGREVFIGKCGECHTLQPPIGRSAEEWKAILPRMSRRAQLSNLEAGQVAAYVLSSRAAENPGPGRR